jgi:ankyrin repeat protein
MSVFGAIEAGDAEALGASLAADPAAVAACNPQGIPALLYALYCRRQELAQVLLEAGAPVDLFTGAALGFTHLVLAGLDNDPELLAAHSSDGWTLLHLAAFFGRLGTLRALLARGADPLARASNPMGNLALHAAAAAGQNACVLALLEAGTPPNATQNGGYTALHSAAQGNDLVSAAHLLARGADPRLGAADGRTPHDLAVAQGHTEMLALLG